MLDNGVNRSVSVQGRLIELVDGYWTLSLHFILRRVGGDRQSPKINSSCFIQPTSPPLFHRSVASTYANRPVGHVLCCTVPSINVSTSSRGTSCPPAWDFLPSSSCRAFIPCFIRHRPSCLPSFERFLFPSLQFNFDRLLSTTLPSVDAVYHA